jgi:triosephosphate isomerase
VSDFSVFVNFKTYKEASGENSLNLAKICLKFSEEGFSVIPVVQALDLYRVTSQIKKPVWVQHFDDVLPGKFTGWITPEAVKESGGEGALLNHSEHPLPPGTVKHLVSKARQNGLKTMVCVKTLGQLKRLVKFKPDFLGYEISEFIGTATSITEVSPKSVAKAVKICGEIPLIVGAGINKKEDLVKAKELGARGVLISSAVVLAENQEQKLRELLSALSEEN